MENQYLRKLIRECLDEVICEGQDFMIDEMAYPESFNFQEFKSISSFAGKQKYAKERLLGKVGAGSSRAVFKIDDQKVLKVALNDRGIAQNNAEADKNKQSYSVVARVFDVDQDDMWIEMELAKKISTSRFNALTHTTPGDVSNWMAEYQGKPSWGNPPDLSENEFALDLNEFTEDFQYPVPGDFEKISTYGEVLRNGVPTVVVIDFGFDRNSMDIYRAHKQKAVEKYKRKYAY